MSKTAIHFALGEDDFRALVTGHIVEKRTHGGERVRLILSDIGYAQMIQIIAQEMAHD